MIGSTGFYFFLAIYDASMDDISTKLADLYEMGLESLPSRITIGFRNDDLLSVGSSVGRYFRRSVILNATGTWSI